MSTQIQTTQIKITQKAEINEIFQGVYDARTLHIELQSKKQFSDWIKNRLQDFVETVDFISFTPKSEKPLGGRPSTEYLLTIDTAKHLSMMEQTDIGKKVRNAFIQAEKELRKLQQQPQIKEFTKKELLLIALENEERIEALENTVKQKKIIIEEKDAQIEVQDATIDKISNIQDTYSLRQAKGNLFVTEGKLKEYLFAKKWFQYLSNGKSGAEKKNTMQATAYAVGRNFAKDVNVENRKQQRFFKQFRITKHGMAFLIKHRNEYTK